MATWFNGSGWGTREDAIPGEWALLVLCLVVAALLGVAVFWFTMLRHERALLDRSRRRPGEPTLLIEPEPGPDPEPDPDPEPERDRQTDPENVSGSHDDADEAPADPEPEPDPASDPAPDPQPTPEPAAKVTARVGARKLTEEMLERVEHERSRRKSVKWKELAALIEREFDVQVHPRTIERALKRRRAAASSDPASA